MSSLPANIGRYEVLEIIGRGGMGLVYKARDPNIGRLVALKIIKLDFDADEKMAAEMRERFRREAAAAGTMQHPNIVSVYDAGEADGVPFIALEYVEGETLEKMIRPGELLPLTRVAAIIGQVASGLAFAHERGIIHRDVKPANVIVTPTGTAKIMDFGIARIQGSELTQKGMVMGSPAYMAPEQITGSGSDARSDVFSLGVVLYQLLTGEKPFPGDNPTSVSYRILRTDPVEPSKLNPLIDPAFNRIIAKALAKRPEDRYQNALELAQDLEALAAGRPLAGAGNTGETTMISAAAADEPKAPADPNSTQPQAAWVDPAPAPAPAAGRPRWLIPAAAGVAILILLALLLLLRNPYGKIEKMIAAGQHQAAVVALVEMRQSHPGDPRAACLLGREYAVLELFPQALDSYAQGMDSKYCHDAPDLVATIAAAVGRPETVEPAIKLAVKIGPPVIPALQVALTDPDYDAHWNAARALKTMGETVNEVELNLLDIRTNPDCEVRGAAEDKVRGLAGAGAEDLIAKAQAEGKDLPSCAASTGPRRTGSGGGATSKPKPRKKQPSNWLDNAIRKFKGR